MIRVTFAQLFQLFQHIIGCIHNIAPAGFIHFHGNGVVSVHAGIAGTAFVPDLYVGHIPQQKGTAIFRNRDTSNICGRFILGIQPDGNLPVLRIHGTGGYHCIFAANGVSNIFQGKIVIVQLLLVNQYSNFLFRPAGNGNIGHALCLLQFFLKGIFCHGVQVGGFLFAGNGNFQDRIFLGGTLQHNRLINVSGKGTANLVQPFCGLYRSQVGILAPGKLYKDFAASRHADGTDLFYTFQRRDGVFNRFCQLLLHRFRTGAGIFYNAADVR